MPQRSTAANSKTTVYVVEDDPPVRDSLVALLESEGFKASAFASANAFLAHYHPGGDACVLMDLELPEKTGLDLLETLAAREHHLPIFVITGNPDLRARARALDLGALAVFLKPSDPVLLVDSIRGAIC
jgi:FixJ family two-component response regulator